MAVHSLPLSDDGHGSTPPSGQKSQSSCAENESEDFYHETLQSQTVQTKLHDGQSTEMALLIDDLESSSRPCSSGSDVYHDSSQVADDELLALNEVQGTGDDADPGAASIKLFSKPEIPLLTVAHGTFKMPARLPHGSTTKQAPPHNIDQQQDQQNQSLPELERRTGDTIVNGTTGNRPHPSIEPDSTPLNEASQTRTIVGNIDGAQRFDASAPPVPESTLSVHADGQSAPLGKETRLPAELINAPTAEKRPPSPLQPRDSALANVAAPRKTKRRTKAPRSREKRRPVVSLDDIEDPITISKLMGTEPTTVPTLNTAATHAVMFGGAVTLPTLLAENTIFVSKPDRAASPDVEAISRTASVQTVRPSADGTDAHHALQPADGDSPQANTSMDPRSRQDVPSGCESPSQRVGLHEGSTPEPCAGKHVQDQGSAQPTADRFVATKSSCGTQATAMTRPLSSPSRSQQRSRAQADSVLHSPSERSGSIRVSKTKPDDSTVVIKLQDVFNIMEPMLNQSMRETLQESIHFMDNTAAKLREAVAANNDIGKQLQDALAQLVLYEDRYKELKSKASRMKKFVNGLGGDLTSVKKSNLESLNEVQTEQASLRGQLSRLKIGSLSLARDLGQATQRLEEEKKQIEQQLNDKTGQLSRSEEETQRLQQQLDCKIGELAQERDTVAVLKKHLEQSALRHEEIEKIFREMEGRLASKLTTLLQDNRVVRQSDQAEENCVVTLLEQIKSKIPSQETFVAEATSLRETIATLEERLRTSETTIADLNSSAVQSRVRETSLKERVSQLEATNSALKNENVSSGIVRTQLQEATLECARLRSDFDKMNKERSLHVSELEKVEQQKEDFRTRLEESEARQVTIPDFGQEREKLQEQAQRDLAEKTKIITDQALANQTRHNAELQQAKKEMQLLEKKISGLQSELEPIRSENQLLKEQSRSALDKEKLAQENIKQKDDQIRQLGIEITTEREKTENVRRESDISLKKLQEEYQDVQKKLSAAESANQNTPQPQSPHPTILPRKPKRKVDRNQSSQSSNRIQVPQNEQNIHKTHFDKINDEEGQDDDLLDNHQPGTPGFDASALDSQILDHDGVRMVSRPNSQAEALSRIQFQSQNSQGLGRLPAVVEETQSQVQIFENSQADTQSQPQFQTLSSQISSRPPAVVEETQSQVRVFENLQVDEERQQQGPSSPLSDNHSSYGNYEQISLEMSEENRRHASHKRVVEDVNSSSQSLKISQGKKRDPERTPLANKAAGRPGSSNSLGQRDHSSPDILQRSQPRHGYSHRDKFNFAAAQHSRDVHGSSMSPVKAKQKRAASERSEGEVTAAKRPRVTGPSSTPSQLLRSSQSRFGSTPQTGSSASRSVMTEQLSKPQRSSNASGSTRRTKARSTRNSSKMEDRFRQESEEL